MAQGPLMEINTSFLSLEAQGAEEATVDAVAEGVAVQS